MGNQETPFSKYAAQGGRARASVLTPDERKEIARSAARARWGESKGDKQALGTPEQDAQTVEIAKDDSQEECSPPFSKLRGKLMIGGVEYEAHVLNDLRRALTVEYLLRDLLIDNWHDSDPTIQFRVPGSSQIATGYEGTLFVEICEEYLEARDRGLLKSSQLKLAEQAEVVMRACAKVGIVALIDEATGYQKARAKHAFRLIVQDFVAYELQEWAKRFPEDFWYELARLESVHYSPRSQPLRWGRYLMMFVFDAVDHAVGAQLRKKASDSLYPIKFDDRKEDCDSNSLTNFREWLLKFRKDKLHNRIGLTVPIMRSCKNMDEFRAKFDRVFKKGPLPLGFDDLDCKR